jgi:ribose 5-phosphate isomerase B
MKVGIGGDHAGFPLKEDLREFLIAEGHEVVDKGTFTEESVDYPDFTRYVAESVQKGEVERGIVICGSGVGASVVANKIRGIRAGLCHDTYSAHQGVEHDDMNVLCLGGRIIGVQLAREIVQAFVGARFTEEERHKRRLSKLMEIEAQNC